MGLSFSNNEDMTLKILSMVAALPREKQELALSLIQTYIQNSKR